MAFSESRLHTYRAKHSQARHAAVHQGPLRILPLVVSVGQQSLLSDIAELAADVIEGGTIPSDIELVAAPSVGCWAGDRPRARTRVDTALEHCDAVLLLFGGDLDADCTALGNALDISTRRRRSIWKGMPVAVVAAAERSELALEYAVHSVLGVDAEPVAGVWLQPSLIVEDPRTDYQVQQSTAGIIAAMDLVVSTMAEELPELSAIDPFSCERRTG